MGGPPNGKVRAGRKFGIWRALIVVPPLVIKTGRKDKPLWDTDNKEEGTGRRVCAEWKKEKTRTTQHNDNVNNNRNT